MKKLLLTTAVLAAFGVAAPAFADADAKFAFNKDKDVEITVDTEITKDIDVAVDFDQDAASAAQAGPAVNSRNQGNKVESYENGGYSGAASSSLQDSMTYNTGVGLLNQDSGNFANQGNVAAAALVVAGQAPAVDDTQRPDGPKPDKAPASVAHAEAYGEQITAGNEVSDNSLYGLAPSADATIAHSLNDNTGVMFANQNAGNANSQHNVLALAVGDNAVMALADAGLRQVNSENSVYGGATTKTDAIRDSLKGNVGVVAVNQSAGAMNNQATVVNVAAVTSAVTL